MNLEHLADLILTRGAATADQIRGKSRQELEKILDASLLAQIRAEAVQSPEHQQQMDEIQADRQRMAKEQQFLFIFRTPVLVNGKFSVAIDNQANRGFIAGWAHEDQGEFVSPAWFKKVLSEQPQLVRQLSWKSADILDPAKRRQADAAQAAEERRVFHDFCRDNGFSEVEANVLLIKSTLGSFDQYSLAQAVQSNALGLAQASPKELEQFQQERIELHNQHLLSLDIPTLRKLAREAGARMADAPAPSPDETQKIRQAEHTMNYGEYPSLPDEFHDGNGPEEVLNAEFIKKCSKETLRLLIKRYGSDQINQLLRNRVAGSIWEV